MRSISPKSSLETYLDHLEFTEASLSANRLTRALAAPYLVLIDEWSGIYQHERASRRDVTRTAAVVGVLDRDLDDATMLFTGAALVEVRQDRSAPLFKRLMPMVPSEFVRTALRTQAELTIERVVPEIERLPATSPLHGYVAPLREGATALIAGLEARSRAEAARASAAADVAAWKARVNQQRVTTLGALLQVAAAEGKSRSWAQSFFPREAQAAHEEPEAPPTT